MSAKTPLLAAKPTSSSSTIVPGYGATIGRDEEEAVEELVKPAKGDEKVGKKFSEIWVLCIGLWASIFCSAVGESHISLLEVGRRAVVRWGMKGKKEGRRRPASSS